ncbi:MAG: hypothetical protein FWE76_04885 [Symbiobacteriaceae bacterium]|nr:hypothetical protein [Symbiobacteriaceae bacterium]
MAEWRATADGVRRRELDSLERVWCGASCEDNEAATRSDRGRREPDSLERVWCGASGIVHEAATRGDGGKESGRC